MTAPRRSDTSRSPLLAILGWLTAGAMLAVALLLVPASGGSGSVVTGSVLFAFGLGWGLIAWLSSRFSAQPQPWMAVPALFLGSIDSLEAQDELPQVSPNSTRRVVGAATHTSVISGDDAPASTQAILDVVTAIRSGTALR